MMLEIYERLGQGVGEPVDARIVLDHEQRDRGRFRTLTSAGVEVRLFLERGRPLRVGELLRSQCGKIVIVEGAVEPVLLARCDEWSQFSQACYHLGNRHVKIQLGSRWLRVARDHVIEDLLRRLGLDVIREQAVFVPESGAYDHGHHHH